LKFPRWHKFVSSRDAERGKMSKSCLPQTVGSAQQRLHVLKSRITYATLTGSDY